MQCLMRSNTALNWIQLKVGGRNLETHNLETYQECNCSSCCNWSFQCRLKLFGKPKICHLDSYLYHKMVGIALTRLEFRFNAKTGSLRNEVKLSKVIWKVCVCLPPHNVGLFQSALLKLPTSSENAPLKEFCSPKITVPSKR